MRIYQTFNRILIIFLAVTFLLPSCQKLDYWNHNGHQNDKGGDGRIAMDWYRLQLQILLERNSTMNGVYFAYLGIGLYESIQPGINNGISFSKILYQMPGMPNKEKNEGYDWEISANAAMAALLRSFNNGLTPANNFSIDSLENAYNAKLQPGAGSKFTRSQEFGRKIAEAVFNWSKTDNFDPTNTGYVAPDFEGAWIPTPPALVNPPVMPFMSKARPLLESNLGVLADPFPLPYSEINNSDFYNMAKHVYDVSNSLTDEQKDIANFFVDQGNGSGYTPPGHDFSIITQALFKAHADLETAAETYAKAGIAEREALIICFSSKYKYNLIRPVSYIQRVIDAAWLPYIVTPPHPEYPAAHAFITGAATSAAQEVLGSHLSFTDHSYDFKGWAPRSYNSLFDAAREAGISRLYGGIHYLNSINIGLELGEEQGKKVGLIKLRY